MPVRPCRLPAALAIGAVALAWPAGLRAQMASERATLKQKVSGTEIVIDYSRPSARGRDTIFGGEVSWDEVWTPGANQSTTIHFSKDVTLADHEVKAGTYGVWIQVREGQDWIFMLHPDTTLFHVPHAKLEDGILTFPVKAEPAPYRETLTWDLQRIRALGADLEMHWADTRVRVPVGVDLGVELTVAEADAQPYLGTWRTTRLKTFTDSMEAEWKKEMSAEEIAEFDAWYRPAEATVSYDAARQWLVVDDDPEEPGPDMMLLPRGEHAFRPGWMFLGELSQISRGSVLTFTMGPDGRATSAEMRNTADKLTATMERLGP